jgi:ATP-dependent Zn protease
MVIKWGMSDRVGPIDHGERDIADLSPETRQMIDDEIKLLVNVCPLILSYFELNVCPELEEESRELIEQSKGRSAQSCQSSNGIRDPIPRRDNLYFRGRIYRT